MKIKLVKSIQRAIVSNGFSNYEINDLSNKGDIKIKLMITVTNATPDKVDMFLLKQELRKLSPIERQLVFDGFCKHCFIESYSCYCERDPEKN